MFCRQYKILHNLKQPHKLNKVGNKNSLALLWLLSGHLCWSKMTRIYSLCIKDFKKSYIVILTRAVGLKRIVVFVFEYSVMEIDWIFGYS